MQQGGKIHVKATGTTTPRALSDRFADVVYDVDFTSLQNALDYSSDNGVELVITQDQTYSQLSFKDGIKIRASNVTLTHDETVQPSIVSDGILTSLDIDGAYFDGTLVLYCTPDAVIKINDQGAKNENLNANFHTWARADYRGVDSFDAPNPIVGDADSYDGTGGLRLYGADAWYNQIYGNQGSSTITRMVVQQDNKNITNSEFYVNYVTDSVVPPLSQFNLTITSATTLNAATVELTVGAHSLSVNDYVWWDGAVYNSGTVESTFQVTAITATTVTVSNTADLTFTSWSSFGRITDDPDNTGDQHIHDPALGTIRRSWIRNGTSGIDFGCRVPVSNLEDYVTVRLNVKLNSGHTGWFPRIFQNFGLAGSANTSTTMRGITLTEGVGQKIIVGGKLPSFSGKTFGKGSFSQINLVPTIYYPDVDMDIFEYSVYKGCNLPLTVNSDFKKEDSLFRKLYRVSRADLVTPVTSGRFYSLGFNFDTPMYGTPDVTYTETSLQEMIFSSKTENKYGVSFSYQAQNTVNVGVVRLEVECEYKIPTNYIG